MQFSLQDRWANDREDDITTSWHMSWTRKSEAPCLLPCYWNVDSACLFCPQSLLQGHSLEMVMLRTPAFLYKLQHFGAGIHSSCCHPRQNSYASTLNVLKQPPTNLEWPASFLGLSLLSAFGSQFQITPGKPLRVFWADSQYIRNSATLTIPRWETWRDTK